MVSQTSKKYLIYKKTFLDALTNIIY